MKFLAVIERSGKTAAGIPVPAEVMIPLSAENREAAGSRQGHRGPAAGLRPGRPGRLRRHSGPRT